MTIQDTLHMPFFKIGNTDNQAAVTAYDVSYPTAGTFTNKSVYAIEVPYEANALRLRIVGFGNAAAVDGYTGRFTAWQWEENGGALDLMEMDFTCGTTVITTDPVTEVAFSDLTTWGYADIFTEIAANRIYTNWGTANGIGELRFDLLGGSHILVDFDLNAAGGTACTKAFALGKWY